MSYQAYNNEIEIQSVLLLSEQGEILVDLAAETVSGKIGLDYITFTESLFSPIMDGSLIYDATKGEYESLNLTGRETIKIIARSPAETDDDEDVTIELPEFSVYSFQDSSNVSDTNKTPEGGTIRKLTLSFCSKEAKEIFEKPDLLPDGFIGKISTGYVAPEDPIEEEDDENDGDPAEQAEDPRGLVEIIAESIPGGIDSEPTHNDVWIKPKVVSFPSRKELEAMTPLQMINYCKSYAMSQENPVAVNYFFWQDLAGFHFKSADLMIYESFGEDGTDDDLKTFTVNSNIIGKNRIYGFDIITDFSLYASLSNNALYSYYERIEPDYFSSPYARLMDDREKFLTKKITCNYKDMYANGLESVEEIDPFYYLTKEDIEAFENEKFKSGDVLFGYHDDRAYNDGDSIRSVLLRGNDLIIGSSGESDTSEEEEGGEEEGFAFVNQDDEQEQEGSTGPQRNDISHFNVYEPGSWQAMFDCMNLDGEILKKIIKEIKQPTFEAKKKYRDMLAYKEQWNIYKYSVCCAVDQPSEESSFMAVIKGYRTIGRNIYRYSWSEVTFIPKIELGNFMGATMGDLSVEDYGISVEQLNTTPINMPYPSSEYKFTKFGQDYFPEVIGDLSGEIFVSGPTGEILEDGGFSGCGITFSYTNAVTRAISQYFADCENPGMTLTFYNDKYSPFLIMEKPNGAQGSFENSSGAYNLNEIMNRVVYDESTYPKLDGASMESILYYQSGPEGSIDMPNEAPSSDEIDILTGPGINASKEYTDYPKGFASMPIGSYQLVARDPDGNPIVDAGLECAAIPFGHISKISAVKTDDLPKYGIDLRKYGESGNLGSRTIYYFNATNAQDGKCDDLVGDCGIGVPLNG